MPKVSPLQNSFNAGELSPLLAARSDLDRYKAGLAVCVNYVPAIQGPLLRRPGGKYIAEQRHSDREAILLSFKYSRDESYIIEFGTKDDGGPTEYFRFFKNGAVITDSSRQLLGASGGTITISSLGFYTNGTRVVFSNVSGSESLRGLNNREVILASVTGAGYRYTLLDAQTSATIDGSDWSWQSSTGTISRIYELSGTSGVTPSLSLVQTAQSGDVLFCTIPEHPPFKLSRYTDSSWTYTPVSHTDGPYLSANDTTTTLNVVGGVTGSIAIVASDVSAINNGAGFSSDDIGRLVRVYHSNVSGYATITAAPSTVSVTANVARAFNATGTSTEWRLGAWSRYVNPLGICFHEGRLFFGGGIDTELIAASAVDDYTDFAPPITSTAAIAASDAFTTAPNGVEANAIQWLVSDEKGLVVGTKGGPWIVRANATGDILDAGAAINIKKATGYGSAGIQPAQVDKATLYVQSSTKKVRELLYFYDVDGFRASDLTVLSEHIPSEGIVKIAHQRDPQPILWGVRSDGVLIGLTYERDIDNLKAGWHRHIFGGYSDVSSTVDAKVKSIAVVPSDDGTREELYVIVERYINGRTKKFVEYLQPFYDDTMNVEDAFYVDAGATYDGTATAQVGSLFHLAGQVVSILADGAVHPDRTVSTSGLYSINLDVSASKIHVGLAYDSKAQMMRLDAGSADGTGFGKTQRTHRVALMLKNTNALELGMDFTSMREINFRDATDTMDSPVPLFTGIKSEEVEANYDFQNQICLRQNKPLPGTIVGISPQLHTQDR